MANDMSMKVFMILLGLLIVGLFIIAGAGIYFTINENPAYLYGNQKGTGSTIVVNNYAPQQNMQSSQQPAQSTPSYTQGSASYYSNTPYYYPYYHKYYYFYPYPYYPYPPKYPPPKYPKPHPIGGIIY